MKRFFKKFSMEKLFFAFKVYDLIITNVHLLTNSSNREVMFSEYSRNIPRMSISKIFQGMKIFLVVKKFKKLFCGYPVKIVTLAVSSLKCFSELSWNCFTFRVMFWKDSHRSLTAGKDFKIAQHYYNHYKSFPSSI